jgi:hypothetical protein
MSAHTPAISVRSLRMLPAMREMSTAPRPTAAALAATGSAMPTAKRKAPIGGATLLVGEQECALHARIGDTEILVSHQAGEEGAAR